MRRALILLLAAAISIGWTHGNPIGGNFLLDNGGGFLLDGSGGKLTSSSLPPSGYVGPGDIATGALAWSGLRGYNAAYSGNAANICTPADAVCLDVSIVDGSLNATTLATLGCNNTIVVCTIKTLYDQSGGTNCNSTACDLIQATIANRPIYVAPGAANGCTTTALPCMGWTSGQFLVAANVLTASSTQPFSVSSIGIRTGDFSNFQDIIGTRGGNVQLGFASSSGFSLIYAGGVETSIAAANSTWLSMQGMYNGASSKIAINGILSNVSPGSATPASDSVGPCMGQCNNGLTGNSVEGGWWPGDISSSFSAVSANQHSFWGF